MKRNYKIYVVIWVVLSIASIIGVVKTGALFWILAVIVLGIIAVFCAVSYMTNYMNHVDTSSDFRIKAQTSFIRLSAADAEGYMEKASIDEIRELCKKVYEALRYADPMSTEALQDIEHQISNRMFVFGEAVGQNDLEQAKEISTEIINLVGDRERICKAIK